VAPLHRIGEYRFSRITLAHEDASVSQGVVAVAFWFSPDVLRMSSALLATSYLLRDSNITARGAW
jgi:hypothetical protein